MIRYLHRTVTGQPSRIAVFPGAFNPPTVAHLAIAAIAAEHADEIVLLVAETMPHKGFEGAGFEARMEMLSATATHPRMSVASSSEGFFVEIAESFQLLQPKAELSLVCGRDAAERILQWPYEDHRVLEHLFARAELWVFARRGEFIPPETWQNRIRCFPFDADLQELSASEVRLRIAHAEPWKHLVPEGIHDVVEKLYRESYRAGA